MWCAVCPKLEYSVVDMLDVVRISVRVTEFVLHNMQKDACKAVETLFFYFLVPAYAG